jgi:hypothetical protein
MRPAYPACQDDCGHALVIPAKIELCHFLDGEDGAVAQAAGLTCS